ncbi:ArpA protein [Streptomyces roseifaciens]
MALAETGFTPRRMRNGRRREIHRHGRLIPALYGHPALRRALGHVAGEDVLECPYEPEQYVITELTVRGDTHGWHWDDYSFALVWVIDCPPPADGGFVECVPHTTWDKDDSRLHRLLIDRPPHPLLLAPGDLYVMRTDRTLHRVHPLHAGRRLIVNMAYASRSDLGKPVSHETMDALWAEGPATPGGSA